MILQFDEFRVDTGSREFYRGGAPVALEPRALKLLEYLIRHRERAISKDELQSEVWGTVVGDAAIARCVTRLRKALGDSADTPRYLRTVRGHGYRFVAALDDDDSAEPRRERPSIAVLPLRNIGGDRDSEYFSDGVADELLVLLARVPDLRVVSRASSFRFRDRDDDLPAIADQLGVDFLLDGSIRRHERRLRIALQLIDAHRDETIWSDIFDRELADVFALQSEIASMVVARLKLAAGGRLRRYDATSSVDAYDYYLRGRWYFHSWAHMSMEHARQMFERAIEIDPTFARAWAGIADTATCEQMWRDEEGVTLARAQEASRRALELAPDLAEAHCSRGFVLTLTGEYDDAAREFETAIELDPMSFESWYLYARSRFAEGRLDDAARLFARASDLRPDDYQSLFLCGLAHGRPGGDQRAARDAAAEGIERAQRALDLRPEDTRALTLGASALASLGRSEEAAEWIERALSIAPDDINVLHNVGCFYAANGEIDRALDVFEKRFALGTVFKDWIDNDPDFDSLRDHPRFVAMLRT